MVWHGANSCFAKWLSHTSNKCKDAMILNVPSKLSSKINFQRFDFVSLLLSHGGIEHCELIFDFVMCIHGINKREHGSVTGSALQS